MKNNKSLNKKIKDISKAIGEASEKITITHYENILFCIYGKILMFSAAIINLVIGLLLFINNAQTIFINSTALIIFGFLFAVIERVPLKIGIQTHLVSALYSIILMFVIYRFYNDIGPAVWTVASIVIILAMSRVTLVMLLYIALFTFMMGVHIWVRSEPYQMNTVYYITQTCFFGILFIISSSVHKINVSRYRKLHQQFKLVFEKKEEILTLYEEISASEEDLRIQNNILLLNNAEIKGNEEKLNYLAYFDTLTELPNRKMILEQLHKLINVSQKKGLSFYVVFIDIDHFKKVNDTMGHHMGDLLLQSVASRLKESLHDEDLLGRLGGDEFALIIQRNINKEEVLKYIEAKRIRFLEPFPINNTELRSSASFGISVYPQDGEDAIELIKSADTSMYKAKELGKNNVQFFQKEMKFEITQKIELENELLYALKNNEFFLVFQPQYNLLSNHIRGFETLVRWNKPNTGIIGPNNFILLAEEMGLIVPLGEWILRTACEKFKRLQGTFDLDAYVSVNISPVQMKDKRFLEMTKNVLKDTGLNPENLEIEITESFFIESIQSTIEILNELKRMKIRIALDDFGTGYSSLSYLKALPIDTLKIDKSFVDDISLNALHKLVVGDIISLAHNLGVSVIAEGVEEEHQLTYLKTHDCDCVQGFLLGKPLDEEAVKSLLTL